MECVPFSSLLTIILVFFPVASLACVATSSDSSAVVVTTTEAITTTSEITTTTPTTTTPMPCSPNSITYGSEDAAAGTIDVTFSNYSADDITETATMTVSCTTADPNGAAFMGLNGDTVFPAENTGGATVSITLTCSFDTMQWVYAGAVGVTDVSCLG